MHSERLFLKRNITRAVITSVFVLAFVSLVPNSFLVPFRAVLAPIVAPFQGFFSWVAFETGDFFRMFSSVGSLKQQNEHLTRRNRELAHEAARLPEIQEENRMLRELLQLPAVEMGKMLPAEIISRSMPGEDFSLTLNRGSADGVRSGLPVIVGAGQLIGRIAQVRLTSATVLLLSQADSIVAARIAGTSIQGVVRGDHGLGLIFDLALSGEKLEPGARLVTTGLGDNLPKDLSIGEIGEVRLSADRLFQQAVVVTQTAVQDTRFVTIIIGSEL